MQKNATGEDNQAIQQWLDEQGLNDAPRLATQLDVENGWETAVETVLGNRVEAVCVSSCQAVQDSLPESLSEPLTLIEHHTQAKQVDSAKPLSGMLPLSSKVNTDWAVDGLLSQIFLLIRLPASAKSAC